MLKEHDVSEIESVSVLRRKNGEAPYYLDPLEEADLTGPRSHPFGRRRKTDAVCGFSCAFRTDTTETVQKLSESAVRCSSPVNLNINTVSLNDKSVHV
jgi:hypothetical protein